MLTAISIILIIVSLILIILSIYFLKNTHKINKKIDIENTSLLNYNKKLKQQQQLLENQISYSVSKKNYYQDQLIIIQEQIRKTEQNQEDLSKKAFENYCQILENKYKEAEDEYDRDLDALNTAYSNLQLKLIQETDEYRKDLDQIKETRTAVLKAQLREKEIKNNQSFYCVQINQSDINDIKVLEQIRSKLNNQRVLNMLIWSTFYQKPMTALCNNIIGLNVKSGIYKITNQINDMCYIGQAVDIARRWKDHAKCGLGIDTPAKNKLYKAMLEDGLYNFSFEILEVCPKEQLNEKEKYYINLYESYNYGYNSNIGIKGD